MFHGVQLVYDNVIKQIESNVMKDLHNITALNDDQLDIIQSRFHNITNPFDQVDSRYKLDKYVKENLPFLVC